jgi:hypothetical protein
MYLYVAGTFTTYFLDFLCLISENENGVYLVQNDLSDKGMVALPTKTKNGLDSTINY